MVRLVGGTEPSRAAKRTGCQGGREGKGMWGGETVAALKAAASQPGGEEPEGFGSSTFLLMSPFSCCNSESMRREDCLGRGGLLRGGKGRERRRGSGKGGL